MLPADSVTRVRQQAAVAAVAAVGLPLRADTVAVPPDHGAGDGSPDWRGGLRVPGGSVGLREGGEAVVSVGPGGRAGPVPPLNRSQLNHNVYRGRWNYLLGLC